MSCYGSLLHVGALDVSQNAAIGYQLGTPTFQFSLHIVS